MGKTIAAWAACALLLPGAARAGSPPAGEKDALVRVVTQWTADCDGSKRTSWDDMVRAWYNDITDGHGAKNWDADGFYQNGSIVDSDFVDPDEVDFGNDFANDRADEPDVMMIALHGGEADDQRWFGRVRVNEAGDGNCNAYQGHVVLGDTDAEFLHLSSCHSMDDDVWWDEWGESFGGVHQIDGFAGIMWISGSYTDRYEDFSDDAFDVPIAEAWYDNHYDSAFWPGEHDHCPVARGVGASVNDLWNRMDHEEYDNVFSDPATDRDGVIWIEGCDPKDESPLPQ